jgi:hypothetical protein
MTGGCAGTVVAADDVPAGGLAVEAGTCGGGGDCGLVVEDCPTRRPGATASEMTARTSDVRRNAGRFITCGKPPPRDMP